jgi:hypothetical protein
MVVRLGDPIGVNGYGRSVYEREFTIEARLPEAHQHRIVHETLWRCSDGHQRRVRMNFKKLHRDLREASKKRLSSDKWEPPLVAPRVWIDPGKTPREVTAMALFVIFWQEGVVKFGPDESPDAWQWVKKGTRITDDGQCWAVLDTMRRHYVNAEDWRGLRRYLRKVTLGEQRALGRARAKCVEEEAVRFRIQLSQEKPAFNRALSGSEGDV